MQSLTIHLLSLALLVLASAQSNAAETLRWKFQSGEKISFQITQTLETMAAAGTAGKFDVTIEQTSDITWQVDEVTAEGNAKIRQTFDRVQMKLSSPGGDDNKYDSASEEPPMGHAARFASLFHALTDCEFGLVLSPQGKIVKVQVPPEFFDAMKIVSSGPLDELATEESIKQMISAITIEFPEKPLDVNDKWESKVDTTAPILGKLTVVTSYQFMGNKEIDGQSLVAIKPTITMQPASEPDARVQMTFENQSTTGEIYFDLKAGRLHSGQVEQIAKAKFGVKEKQVDGTIKQGSKFQSLPNK
jgi:hypothetical protein